VQWQLSVPLIFSAVLLTICHQVAPVLGEPLERISSEKRGGETYFTPPYDDAQFERDGAASEALFFSPFAPGNKRRACCAIISSSSNRSKDRH
jgi:hypothetical protein